MRPIKSSVSNKQYQVPSPVPFSKASLPVVKRALRHTHPPQIGECLDLWLALVPGALVTQRQGVDAAVKIVQEKVDSIYKKAARPLLDEFGEYCHYCEGRLAQTVDVEHRLPKSEYPDLAVSWTNFLLACGPCNRAKSKQPNRKKVRTKAVNRAKMLGANPTTFQSENDFHDEIVNRQYVWPNVDQESYRHLRVELQYYENATSRWSPVDRSVWDRPDTRIDPLNILRHEATAYFSRLGKGGTFSVLVVVVGPGPGCNDAYALTRAKDTIELCQLNKNGPAQAVSDRRVLHRTKAWFDALDSLKALRQLKNSQLAYDAVFRLCGLSAAASGFFSVWLTVFEGEVDYNGQSLQDRFVREFSATHFPGTDTAYLP